MIKSLILTASIISLFNPLMFSQKINDIELRIDKLLSQMTLEEKIDMLGGTGFETKPIERLGIPSLKMCDGPLGVVRSQATAFPSGILMGATWNPEIIFKLGSALAEEVKAKGRHVVLGPCVNIARLPLGGRNFESFGEDPYLTSRIAVDYIKGVQKENVAATIKHFAVNNQEHERLLVDVQVDERALNEIYFPAFKAAVEEAKVLAVMSAYNKLNSN
ncbi:MAG: glycoside hydrolase family 3 protein, partial [Ignavibacterium sp.]